jgi:4-carboxymuconolactone decarboxylase
VFIGRHPERAPRRCRRDRPPGLSPRDRSLVTVAALVSLYRTDQLGSHLRRALDNGLSKDELVHAITHLAFYAGWPNAMTAITQLKQITEG